MKHLTFSLSMLLMLLFNGCTNKTASEQAAIDPSNVTNQATASNPKANTEAPKLSFEKIEHDFGTIYEGEKVSYAFKFTNTGNADLIISNASGSCGCTVPEYPKKPIKPGEQAVIKTTFDSTGRSGKNEKSVTLITNCTPNQTELKIYAKVEKAIK